MSRRLILCLLVILVSYTALYYILAFAHSAEQQSRHIMIFHNRDYWHGMAYRQKVFIKSEKPSEWMISVDQKSKTYAETAQNHEHLQAFEEAVNQAASNETQIFTWGLTLVLMAFCVFIYRKEWIKDRKEAIGLSLIILIYLGFTIFQHGLPSFYNKEDAGDAYFDLMMDNR